MQEAYTDTFEHNFDAKGRVTVPSEWRGDGHSSRLSVFPSQEGCLKIYPASYLAEKAAELKGVPMSDPRRKNLERLAAMTQAVSWDQQGRVMIKEKLRSLASLTRAAVLVGCLDHFEIWDAQSWKNQRGDDLTLEEVAGEVGL